MIKDLYFDYKIKFRFNKRSNLLKKIHMDFNQRQRVFKDS